MSTARKLRTSSSDGTEFPPPSSSSAAHGGLRLPPQAVEAEESVLGSVLIDNGAIDVTLERIRAEDFYRIAHRQIFESMVSLTERREPVDIVTLSSELRGKGHLESSGGIDYLTRLANFVPSAGNAGFYARQVKEAAIRRRVIHEATNIIEKAFKPEGDMEEFLGEVERRILDVADHRITPAFHRVSDVVQDSIKLVERLYDRKEPVTGVPSGFPRLDHMTAGFQPSDLIILAARPAMGKTALAMSVAQWVGVHRRQNVAVFALEMSKEQLVLRMLCAEARVENTKVRTGHLGERDFPKLVDAASRIAEAPIFIDDTAALTITELRAKCRRLHREHPLSLVVVDYLQLMRSPAYSHSREQEISDISRSLKALAKELHVPVIALSQLNRSVESRTDKRPMMSDLRESGAIEQDADIIMFIYRDEVYNQDPNNPEKGVAEVIIAKQRSGPTGTARLAFSGEYTRFDALDERADLDQMEGTEFDLASLADDGI